MATTNQKCYVLDIGEHWSSAKSIDNMLSLSDVADECRVTLDTSKEKAFRVYFPCKIVKFKQLSNLFCGLMPSDESSYEEHPIDLGNAYNLYQTS